MKKTFVILLCLLAVFAIVSCKQDPKDSESKGETFYRLTATRTAKRFALQYAGDSGLEINPKEGDVLSLKYRSNHPVTHLYLRDDAGKIDFLNKYAIDDEDDPYVSQPDNDGWITLTFKYPEEPKSGEYGEDGTVCGFRLELTNYLKPETGSHDQGIGKFVVGDYLDIKDLTFNGKELTIEAAGADGQSDQGVWNMAIDDSNTDHTIPTLEVKTI